AQIKRNNYDHQLATPQMDANPFDVDKETKLKIARLINDGMAKITEESKGVILSAASIPLDLLDSGGLKEMDRAVKTLGIKAIGVMSHIRGKPLDSPQFLPFWARAVELDVPVYIHPIDPFSSAGRTYEKDFDLTHNFGWPFETVLALARLVFSGIMEKYPTLKVVSHHLGGGLIPFMMGRTTETYENERQQEMIGKTLKKPLIEYFKLFYYDTAVGGHPPAIRCAIDTFGIDQIVFATDAPWGPKGGEVRLQQYPGIVKSLGLPAKDYEKIMAGNARRLLKV
ncbi:MAG: amidohydrolase family protein, partial [Dehalococcoidia bacterium]|nr:amidohydrolase family protein [Dehalococcoidia bacterium]